MPSGQSELRSGERVETEHLDVLHSTQSVIREALVRLGYEPQVYDLLKQPLRVLTVRFPVRMDDGSVRVFTGFRAQHNDAVGPTQGGIRLHPEVNEHEICALSIWMSVQCGIANLPYGGGKGGIVCDPRHMSYGEIERLSRAYVRAISQIVGPTKDIPAPDLFSNAQNMAWMLDEYAHLREFDSPGFITGKPVVLGGSRGRDSATARGVAICIEEAARHCRLPLAGARAIVQGFGGVGSYLAKWLAEQGVSVVGIADAYGALYDEHGLDIPDLLERRDSFGTVTKLFRHTISNAQLLEMPCDILIPAAIAHQVTQDNVERIQARMVIEAVQGPTTPAAAKRLHERGVLLVPDLVAHSGSVILSYFEWVQNNQGLYWSADEVNQRLQSVLTQSFRAVHEAAQKYGVDMRLAAYMVGVQRMAEAARWRGWV
ncbi:MAG: Glu/Leu/Phe/Val dehydrogenase [Alicyclobacillus sp.]|nr:Glu/Leu/Phe/Val dehydrogenase [Alicyclobacillus sp.]